MDGASNISNFLAATVTKRQWILEESIGTMLLEDQAFRTVWTTLSVALVSFILGEDRQIRI